MEPRPYLAQAVGHELKFTIRGNEANGPVVFEARKAHALVKLDVLQLNTLALAWGKRGCDGQG